MSSKVGIVVLNWNGGEQTHACIESVRRQTYADKLIVLVDNASLSAERDTLRQRYGDAGDMELISLDDNRGYAGGNNAGIERALARGADVVVIATQDVVFERDALAEMIAASAASGVGVVGPRVIDSGDAGRLLSVGERVVVPLLCVPRTLLRYRRRRAVPYEVGGVLGCALLLTRPCLQTVKGFDEGFFAYYEEIDLCLRARRAGFRVVCAPRAVVRHDGMRGFAAGLTPLSAELKARNLIRLIRRWARPLDYLVLVPTYIVLLAASMGLYALRGRGDLVAAMLRGIGAGLRGREGKP